jgi:two-component system OmpR family response regulator
MGIHPSTECMSCADKSVWDWRAGGAFGGLTCALLSKRALWRRKLEAALPRVLTIEDDDIVAQEIVTELTAHGFDVLRVADGREGLLLAASGDFDAITLDRMLPGMDGLAVISVLRGAGVETPVLMISALSDVDERVKGLRAGGDDYLTKPFASEEMAARLEVLLRRKGGVAPDPVLRVGELELDTAKHLARHRGTDLGLMPTEFKLLEYMIRNPNQILTRTMIFEAVWGYHYDPGTNLIDVHIGRLRRKLEASRARPMIQTIRGSGYRFDAVA